MANKDHEFGIYATSEQAEVAVDELVRAGFGTGAITVMFRDNQISRNFAARKNTKPPQGTDSGKTADIPLDGSWGLLSPGTGPVEGALEGALDGMGVPADWADGKVQDGKVLLSVECANPERVTRAREVLLMTGAEANDSSVLPATNRRPSATR
jgi:hypothetical protein